MPHAIADEFSAREKVLLEHKLDITPVAQPLFALPKNATRRPQDYLTPSSLPFGKRVAEWQNQAFGFRERDPEYRHETLIEPIRPCAPTLIAIFYPDNEDETIQRRPDENYLTRLARLAALTEQTIIYAPPSISHKIRDLRTDKHWHVIDDYETIWDMPNNRHQRHNFTHVQPKLFANFETKPGVPGFEPEAVYNHPHRSAVYNAKAFVTYDAVMRNPFGSERWMYVDAGLFDEFGPVGKDGELWSDITRHQLSTKKLDRSIGISRDTGVVIGEYMESLANGAKDINHAGWTDPRKSWMCQHFIAQCYVGNSLGMLNYAIRFMQTVDDMDANGFYTAREEFVIPHVAVRYPNTIFSIPWMKMQWGDWEHPIKGCYTTYGGEDASVPAIGDPIQGLICRRYKPRGYYLNGSGIYEWSWYNRIEVYGRRY